MSDAKHDWRTALAEAIDDQRRRLGPHPDLDELIAYHGGGLEPDAARRLQDHLVLCPRCASLLLDLDAFAADAVAPDAATPEAETPAPVVPLAARRIARRRRWVAAATSSAAAIAATMLLVLWPRGAPLPDYQLHLTGAVSSTRDAGSEAPAETRVAAGGPLTLTLQPATAVDGPVTGRAYLRRGGELRPLSASTLEIAPSGVVSLSGTVGADLLLPIGDSELVLAVARPGALPSRRRLAAELGAGNASGMTAGGKKWLGFERRIQVVEPAAELEPGASGPGDADPRVEYAGCRAIESGPVCVLEKGRPLTVWVDHPRPWDVRVDAGDGWRSYPATAVQGGHRYAVEVTRHSRELAVEIRDGETRSIWTLELSHAPPPDWRLEADELFAADAWDDARRVLEPRAAEPDPAVAGPALSLLAMIERWSGQAERGDELYRRAIDAHRRAGRLFDQIKTASGLTYYLIEEKRFAEARELLDSLPVAATGGSADARNTVAYWRGVLAEETGDLRAAMASMARAAEEAERAGDTRDWIFASDLLVRQLNTVGLIDAAADLYGRMQPRVAELCFGEGADSARDACDCARLGVNLAWAGLLALEAGRGAVEPDPASLLEDAERVFTAQQARGEATCVAPDDLPNLRLNRALTALHAGDPAAARRHLERAGVDGKSFPRLALWQLDVEGRILLAEDQPAAALERYRELGRGAELSASPEAAWRAAVGRAMALEALGRAGESLDACAEAEDRLDRESLLVPMHAGRERFIAQRQRASRFCLDLLLRGGRHDRALAAVRRSAGRALRALRVDARIAGLRPADRDAWRRAAGVAGETRREIEDLAARIWSGVPRDEQERLERTIESKRRTLLELFDELAAAGGAPPRVEPAPPGAGTVLLAYHPLPVGWAAFAAVRDGVAVRRLDEAFETPLAARPGEELAALLIEPFTAEIRRATEIHVVAPGALREVDFHALPFDGDLLLAHAPVVYRLGLPAVAGEAPDGFEALVVAGPGLLEATAEAAAVRRVLESRPGAWRVDLLDGAAASGREVRRRLPEVDLLHYAGHADFDRATRGWDSHLALAGGGRLTVGDVLAAPGVPRWVVLSGCQTGRDAGASPVPGIGLAQAFLVAGSEAVVAATADVSDAEARAMMELLYRHWDASPALAAALQKAQLERRSQTQTPDWRHFRILARD